LVALVGSEPALVSGDLALVKSASALGVFDGPRVLVGTFNRTLFELNRSPVSAYAAANVSI
jgi:hypothetical protein